MAQEIHKKKKKRSLKKKEVLFKLPIPPKPLATNLQDHLHERNNKLMNSLMKNKKLNRTSLQELIDPLAPTNITMTETYTLK